MTKKEFQDQLFYYLDYLKLDDKTLKIKYERVSELMDKLYNDLSTNLKTTQIKSLYFSNAILYKETEIAYIFSLPCHVFMNLISFDLDLVITIFKNDDIEYIC